MLRHWSEHLLRSMLAQVVPGTKAQQTLAFCMSCCALFRCIAILQDSMLQASLHQGLLFAHVSKACIAGIPGGKLAAPDSQCGASDKHPRNLLAITDAPTSNTGVATSRGAKASSRLVDGLP